jgi:Asp-tRNA(Asn)/Glu-tRNA(Gln) amidotransferase C subunit
MDAELAVANAPEAAASGFLVPKVIDTEAEG